MKYLMNSAVITSPGIYSYRLVSVEEAKKWAEFGSVYSTVGYEETAEALSKILGKEVPLNRKTIVMKKGEEALVFRLVLPPRHPRLNPRDKGKISDVVNKGYWELGILTKLE